MKKMFLTVLICTMALTITSCAKAPAAASSSSPGTAKDGNELKIEAASMKLIDGIQTGGYQIMSSEDLKTKIDAKENMVVVDTMPATAYKDGRIPTAVNAELPNTLVMSEVTAEQRNAFVSLLPEDKNTPIVVYCGFVACQRSHVGATIAIEEGYTNVYRQPGGIVGWKDAGFSVEK